MIEIIPASDLRLYQRNRIDLQLRCYGGGGPKTPDPIPPSLPPSGQAAAGTANRNLANRKPKGFLSTILSAGNPGNPGGQMKTLLGG